MRGVIVSGRERKSAMRGSRKIGVWLVSEVEVRAAGALWASWSYATCVDVVHVATTADVNKG